MRTKEERIVDEIRNYLNEPNMVHLYEESLYTSDMNELKKLLKQAKSLMMSYVEDADYYLNYIEEK